MQRKALRSHCAKREKKHTDRTPTVLNRILDEMVRCLVHVVYSIVDASCDGNATDDIFANEGAFRAHNNPLRSIVTREHPTKMLPPSRFAYLIFRLLRNNNTCHTFKL